VTPVEIALILGSVVIVVGYGGFILAPAWASYGRIWEKLAASFLSVFMLVTLVAVGVGLGLAIVWSWATFA
jgi:hypothetical protein